MTHKIFLTVLLLFILTGSLSAQKPDDIIGKYHLPNNLDIKIYKINNKYFGEIIGVEGFKNGQIRDKKNPDKLKRNDLLVGKVIINDLEFDPRNREWINGNIYGQEKGMEFNLKITEIRKEEIEVIGSKYFFVILLNGQKYREPEKNQLFLASKN